jgi:cell division control protein 24
VNTRNTSTSLGTLFPSPTSSTSTFVNNGGPVEAANNVLNTRGDVQTSLFQICRNLQQRLRLVPGFEQFLDEVEEEADEDTDPVTVLWRTFRQGYPLMAIYNALRPRIPLTVDENKVGQKKRGQAATYKFIEACKVELKFPPEQTFILTDLYGDDTTGFVKVCQAPSAGLGDMLSF